MSLRDDLIAARALIDTPEKAQSKEPAPLFEAAHEACETEARFWAVRNALLSASNARSLQSVTDWPHADILALFDRAIAKAGA